MCCCFFPLAHIKTGTRRFTFFEMIMYSFKCCSSDLNWRTVVLISCSCIFFLVLFVSDEEVEKRESKRWSSPLQCRPSVETKTKQSETKTKIGHSYAFWDCTVCSRRTNSGLNWEMKLKRAPLVRNSFVGKRSSEAGFRSLADSIESPNIPQFSSPSWACLCVYLLICCFV